MPGICAPIDDGGIGFDYRLGMAIPDYWIRLSRRVPDEEWDLGEMWRIMTDRLPGVKTGAYAEAHDQALVGQDAGVPAYGLRSVRPAMDHARRRALVTTAAWLFTR